MSGDEEGQNAPPILEGGSGFGTVDRNRREDAEVGACAYCSLFRGVRLEGSVDKVVSVFANYFRRVTRVHADIRPGVLFFAS